MILAGDIGATNTRLALFTKSDNGFEAFSESKFVSANFDGLENIVENFLNDNSQAVDCACFGVPGAVVGEVAKITNLPWIVDAKIIKNLLGHNKVGLVNDLEANAYGLNELDDSCFEIINKGEPNIYGNSAIISAGTGLGEAGIHNEKGRLRPFATEGGHCDFAPRNELEIELLRYLLTKFERVSYERVVSGLGLRNIFDFLSDTKRAETPEWLTEEIANDEFGAVIAKNVDNSEICGQTLDIFVSLYGAEAGNLALKMLATNGVFVGGGIAPKILPKLKQGVFLESFSAKGRFRELLEKTPLKVVLNDKAALFGAAHYAYHEIGKL
ncbi:MAG: glucokinase [Pyrinomonadaceae bacterium]|nr:glucokinase [Pyrinomonadaceae bacterium]